MPHSDFTPTGAESDAQLSQAESDNNHTHADPLTQPIPVVGLVIWLDGHPNIYLDTDALGQLFDGRA